MIFHRITINNMFSYHGEQTIELTRSSEGDGRLILVLGRNGFGKTSLLNAVKLLFLGTDEKNLRQGMARATYVLGDEKDWAGLLNRQAKSQGETFCSIRAEIGSHDKVEFVVKRSWNLDGGCFASENEILEVEVDGRPLAGEAASARLDEFLPRELVPFFFFDGEEIRYLAEAKDVYRADAMERLLSLSFVNGVEGALSELTREWRREILPQEIQAQISGEEAKLVAENEFIVALEAKVADLESEKSGFEDQAVKTQLRMDNLRRSGGLFQTEGLEKEISSLEADLQQKQNQLAYTLSTDAPLMANPSLVRASLDPLQLLVDKKSKATDSVLETLFDVLPDRLFSEPPQPSSKLSDEQRGFYTKKLKGILDAFGIQEDEAPSLLDGLDLMRARELLELLRGVDSSAKFVREGRALRLREISKLKVKLEDLKAERREAQYGSSEAGEHYTQFEAEYADAQQQIGKLTSDISRANDQIQEKKDLKKAQKRRIKELEREVHDAGRADNKLKIARGLKDAFGEYRRIRRNAKREQIEVSLNRHFGQLMSGHSLIKRIEVDEDFYLTFLGEGEESIGYSSISHGMRQLAVTALLWALKDVSGRLLPIIVDTPLARIDRENQENLLQHYYPNGAEQVIVLATDSEIDERKYDLIRPQISRVFVLANHNGQSTSANEIKSSKNKAPKWEAVING